MIRTIDYTKTNEMRATRHGDRLVVRGDNGRTFRTSVRSEQDAKAYAAAVAALLGVKVVVR